MRQVVSWPSGSHRDDEPGNHLRRIAYLSRVASDCADMTGGESLRVRIYFAN